VLGPGDIFDEEGIVVRSVRMHRYSKMVNKCLP
jgi:hypothetical protein